MTFIRLLAIAVLFAFCACVFAQDPIPNPDIVVEILDCGYEADLCDDGDCQVSADGFMVVVRANGFSSFRDLEISGGLTLEEGQQWPVPTTVEWKVLCDPRDPDKAEFLDSRWVAPWQICTPGRVVNNQLTYVVELGPVDGFEADDFVIVTLEACLDDLSEDFDKSCDEIHGLKIVAP